MLHVPLLRAAPERHAQLSEDAERALGAAARETLGRDVEASTEGGGIHVVTFAPVTESNLAEARGLDPEARPGDELGVDLWTPTEAQAAFAGVELAPWREFHRRASEDLRSLLEARHRLSELVRSAWINVEYGRRHSEPGRYFVGDGTEAPGTWIRVVVEPPEGPRVWGVGLVTDAAPGRVSFEGLGYEAGADRAPPCFDEAPLSGEAALAFDGIWDVVRLAPSPR